jgi:4-amino-4-deoxy-L-arabinose transferase-like glycosyltransferase/O-antigen ligase
MTFELGFVAALFVLSLFVLLLDSKKSLYILLTLSVFLHKELFSIYSWNLLPIRIFMLAVLVFTLFTLFKLIKNGRLVETKKILLNPALIALLCFWFVAGVSIAFSKNIQASVSIFAFLTTVVAMFVYFGLTLGNNKKALLNIIDYYVVVVFVLSLIGFVQIFVFQKYQYIFGAFWNVPGHIPRVGALFWDVNHFAGLLVLLLPVLSALVIISNWKRRLLFGLMGLSVSTTLLLTNARSGWIACGIAFLVFFLILVFRRLRYKGLAIVFSLLLVVLGALFSQYLNKQSPIRHRIRQYFHYRLDSFDSHFLLLTGSWQVFEEFPIVGGGYGSFYEHFSDTKISATFFARDPAALNTRVPAHSIWGELLAETGILGFSAMLLFYFSVVFTLLFASLKLRSCKEYLLTSAMTGSVTGILIAGVFYSYNSEFFWVVLFLYFLYATFCLRQELTELGERLWQNVFSFFTLDYKFPAIVLFAASSFLILPNLGVNHLIPYDEAIYAKVSRNILQTGDWLTLHWQDTTIPWFEKPPLYFWLSAATLKVLPSSPELAVRLPSALFGIATVMLVYAFGRRLFGKVAGFTAGLSLLTTFHFLYYSRTGMLDVTCGFFILVSLYAYYLSLANKRFSALLVSGLFAGLAVLTKGVVGLMPLIVLAIYEIVLLAGNKFNATLLVAALKRIFVVSMVAAAVFLPWHLKMYQLHGSLFMDNYIGYHVLSRATTEVENKNAPLYWYLIVLKVSMRIWFIALIPSFIYAIVKVVKSRNTREKVTFVLLSAVTIFAVFSISKSKLVWYIIPIYPFLSILVGYFCSWALDFIGQQICRLKYVPPVFFKLLSIYFVACFALIYLLMNKGLVYTGDLTGPQANMMETKNELFDDVDTVYLDRIEIPLALFYNDGPFIITDYTSLESNVSMANAEGRRLVFIVKESRFKKLKDAFPAIRYVSSENEWYLGELVSQ